jgi:hypothetical protein
MRLLPKELILNAALVISLVLCFCIILTGGAITPNHERVENWILNYYEEKIVRVTTAKVVIVDYDLLKHDFPFLVDWSNSEIDKWILKETAYVTSPQTRAGVSRAIFLNRISLFSLRGISTHAYK